MNKSFELKQLLFLQLISITHSAYISALSLFPDMKEHEGLLTRDELKKVEGQAKSQNQEPYLKHYTHLTNKKPRAKITNILQDFFDSEHYHA